MASNEGPGSEMSEPDWSVGVIDDSFEGIDDSALGMRV
jgi:hypothetical protein